jgi:HAD superfamily hydrolase (TIGR01509 family)
VLPDALVFDLDGTIADTESIEYRSVEQVWGDHGAVYGVERWATIVGQSWAPAWVGELRDELARRGEPVPSADDLHHRQHEHKRVLLADLQPRAGMVELITAARNDDVRLAIASNSPLRWVEERLDQLGLRHHFDHLSTVDVASRPKPHPAPYLEACDALDARPAFSVAFEDSTTGTASAVAAGLFTIACPGPLTEGHDLGAAHWLVRSHDDLSLVSVVQRFEAHVAGVDRA